MDNPETQATFGRRHRTKTNNTKTKKMTTRTPPNQGNTIKDFNRI
jgi:hypothetical protein